MIRVINLAAHGLGKYSNGLEEVLHELSLDGWFTDSDGDVESPYGAFAWTSISEAELPSVVDAIDAQIVGNTNDLIGFWGLVEDDRGFVWTHRFAGFEQVNAWYTKLYHAFLVWTEANES